MLRSSLLYTTRPPPSSRGNKATSIALMEPNLYNAYAEYKKEKAKRVTQKLKGKENRKRKSKQIEDFPNFAVKFKNAMKEFQCGTIESSQQSSRADLVLYESFGRPVENKNERPQLIKGIQSARECHSKELKSSSKQLRLQKQPSNSSKFTEAVAKIFKGLDIFNRGRISETNINKWIPESALYFLGKVFQKIRTQRLALNCEEFMNLCLPLLDESSEQDVKWFIDEVNGKEVFHVSIDGTQQERPAVVSPAKKHQTRLPDTKRKRQDRNSQFKLQFADIPEKIKQRQNIIKMREQKDREKEFGIATFEGECFSFFASKQAITSNQKPKESPSDKKSQYSAFRKVESPKVRVFNSSIKKEQPKVSQPTEPKTQKKSVPKFSFQLPSPVQVPPISKSTTRSPKNPIETRSNRFQSQYQLDQPYQSAQKAMTSRIIRQNITSTQSKQSQESLSIKPQLKSTNKLQTDRIEKLSSKLQEYIKFNKEKIEKNKQFIRQNSVPRT